ncbi:MAG: Gfo/Idh/MocA family oxidoreductase, partial [Anaerolineaceae bacterium]|nr:Gfo/Idh/MocA family oxidoreductase [Anaerolineaceae bacterium]
MPIKIAVIGCGWVSKTCHGPAYRLAADRFKNIELVACCDTDSVRAEEFRSLFGFQRAYASYREMLDAENPSMVCLNVPPNLTCEIGTEILQRGYPLLAEKPPGLHVKEVDQLMETAIKHNVANMVAFNRRHMPLMMELKSQLNEHSFGHIDYQLARIGRVNEDFSITAIHAIDSVRFLAGSDYKEIRFSYRSHPTLGINVVDFHLDCVLANGITASIDINPVAGLNIERATIQGDNRSFLLHCNNGFDAPGSLKIFDGGKCVLDLNGTEFSGTDKAFVLDGFYNEIT